MALLTERNASPDPEARTPVDGADAGDAIPSGVIEAELNFVARGSTRPVSFTFEPPPGEPWNSGDYEVRRVPVRNARPLAALGDLSLDRSGFERVVRPSALQLQR